MSIEKVNAQKAHHCQHGHHRPSLAAGRLRSAPRLRRVEFGFRTRGGHLNGLQDPRRSVRLRLFPYLYHPTPTAREALNYQRLQLLGLPMARLLAVGDDRSCFRPDSSFIVTEFAENCQDGRAFYPGGKQEKETGWRDEFCRRNFELIGKLHDAGIYHRGFTPANELWRKRPAPDELGNQLDIIWIDVASCRKLPGMVLRRKLPDDFVNFLRFFQFGETEYGEFLQAYCNAVKIKRFTFDELCSEVKKRLAEKTAG